MFPKQKLQESKKGQNMTLMTCQKLKAKGVDMLLPFKKVKIDGVIEGTISTLNIDLTYVNPDVDPIECSYEFPLSKETIFAKLVCKIGDN